MTWEDCGKKCARKTTFHYAKKSTIKLFIIHASKVLIIYGFIETILHH